MTHLAWWIIQTVSLCYYHVGNTPELTKFYNSYQDRGRDTLQLLFLYLWCINSRPLHKLVQKSFSLTFVYKLNRNRSKNLSFEKCSYKVSYFLLLIAHKRNYLCAVNTSPDIYFFLWVFVLFQSSFFIFTKK